MFLSAKHFTVGTICSSAYIWLSLVPTSLYLSSFLSCDFWNPSIPFDRPHTITHTYKSHHFLLNSVFALHSILNTPNTWAATVQWFSLYVLHTFQFNPGSIWGRFCCILSSYETLEDPISKIYKKTLMASGSSVCLLIHGTSSRKESMSEQADNMVPTTSILSCAQVSIHVFGRYFEQLL
jgi:hypothetical protein